MKQKKQKQEDELQQRLLVYACPECNGSQLISKPAPRADKNGGCAVIRNEIKCENIKCGCVRIVTRYPNGTYSSIKHRVIAS